MSIRLLAVAAIGAVVALTGLATSVQAAPDGFCRRYAEDAVRQNDEARRNPRCDEMARGDHSSRRWNSDYRAHYDWCRTVDRYAADRERDIRGNALRECHRHHGGY